MNRGYLVLGAAAVLAAIIGLYVALGQSDDAAGQRTPGDPKIAEAGRGRDVGGTRPGDHARPSLPPGAGSAAREYVSGEVRVRDHRSADHAAVDVPPAIHPPEGRKIPSQLTSDLAQHLRGVMADCAASVPPGALGASPRLEGEVLMSIKNHQATVTGATFQLRDAAAASQDAVKQCMEQKSVGVATPSGDEADVEGYAINLSFHFP
jgi:hypothetical protein